MSAGQDGPSGDDSPDAGASSSAGGPSGETSVESSETRRREADENILTRIRTADEGALLFLRETLSSVAIVAVIGLILFAISGVWPPMVAVESGSMEPHMHRGDLVFITEPGRFAPDAARGSTGVVTYESTSPDGYSSFGDHGSIIVYENPQRFGPPIIHRAHFWVDEDENWYEKADEEYVRAENCDELANCPAPHSGFVTKGDNNARYDQASGIAPPVRPDWVKGVARVRIPYLGCIRLAFGPNSCFRSDSPDRYEVAPSEPTIDAPAAVVTSTAEATSDAVADSNGLTAVANSLTLVANSLTLVASPGAPTPVAATVRGAAADAGSASDVRLAPRRARHPRPVEPETRNEKSQ